MGRPAPPPVYRDDPDSVSMHTTRSDYDYDDTLQIGEPLPAYSDDPNVSSKAPVANQGASPLPEDEYSVIECGTTQYAFGKPVNTKAVTFRIDEKLNEPGCLFKYIDQCLAKLPPKPLVQVHGYHWQTVRKGNKKEKKQVVDFDIKLSMQKFLGDPKNKEWCRPRTVGSTEKALRGGFRQTVAKDPAGDLEVGDLRQDLYAWCREYCSSNRMLKSFRVNRTVSGLDTNLIQQRIEALIRQTNYRGHIMITFPVEDRGVDIYNPHRINRWRTTPWIRWVFYLSFLWLFTWPLLYFFTARWAIFTVEWPFSIPNAQSTSGAGRNDRKFATISEEAWFLKHRKLIRRLVMCGHQGTADELDLDEEYEDPRALPGRSNNEHVETAVGIIQAGVAGWNAVQRGLGRDPDGWGADS
ncbi:hypothetical protein IWZ00DRAFT_496468 [Phyllosticta capitalensis]|uniref:Uncharacterized protein n=1 Tax=Phyllosticta capitalensis TaxID=121624 RepID=A0ABR1Z3X6_9PEZI